LANTSAPLAEPAPDVDHGGEWMIKLMDKH